MTAIMIRVPSTFYIVKIVKSRSEKDRKRTRKGLEKDRKRTGKGPEKDRKMTEKGSKRTEKGILSEPPYSQRYSLHCYLNNNDENIAIFYL